MFYVYLPKLINMKNTLYFLTIIITFSLLSCNSQKNINKSKDNQSKQQLLEIELSNDGILDFQLKNVSSDPIVIYQPLRLQLEKLEDDKWVKLSITALSKLNPVRYAKTEKGERYDSHINSNSFFFCAHIH